MLEILTHAERSPGTADTGIQLAGTLSRHVDSAPQEEMAARLYYLFKE